MKETPMRLPLIVICLGLSGLLVAKKPVAVPSVSAPIEQESPDVRPDGSPTVVDPDLKDAVPAMRQGTDEPVGGFKEQARKGDSAVSFGWTQGWGTPVALIGWRYWLKERLAVEMGLGGLYTTTDPSHHNSILVEDVGLRLALGGTSDSVLPFLDLRGSARQSQSWSADRTEYPTYTQHSILSSLQNQYAVALRAGAELFWPGSRRVSLEASGGLQARWTQNEYSTVYASAPVGPGTNSSAASSGSDFEVGTDFADLLLALNLHY